MSFSAFHVEDEIRDESTEEFKYDSESSSFLRKRRVHDRNLNSSLMSVRAVSRKYLDTDLFSTSLLHHLGFIEPGIRMNSIFELNYLESYWNAGTERVFIMTK